MNRYKLLVLMILFSSPTLLTEVQAADPDASNSYINITVSEINPEADIEISVWAADGLNAPINGAVINLSCTDGYFTSNSLLEVNGVSGVNGWFNSSWRSPYLSFTNLEQVVDFTANITDDSWISISNTLTVKYLDSSNIDNSEIIATSSILSGETIEISTLVRDSSDNPSPDMQVTYSVTDGTFLSPTQDLTDSTGFFNITWQAPVIVSTLEDYNVTLTSFIEASDSQNITLEKNITILPPPARNFTVSWNHATSLIQNQTMDVMLTVRDKENNSVIVGASVTFLLDIGEWTSTNDFMVTQLTNALGQVTATYNATTASLLLEENSVNITAIISKIDYNDLTNSSIFTLMKLDVFQFSIIVSDILIKEGESVTFQFSAFRNQLPWINATFHIVASAGHFEGSNESLRSKTDSNGELTIIWHSSSIPALEEALEVYFSIELVNSGLGIVPRQITVNLDTDGTSTTEDPDSDPDGISPVLYVGGLVGVGAIGAIVIFLIRKRT